MPPNRRAIRQRALPLAMLAVGLCLLLAGALISTTLLLPGVFYLAIALRGFRVAHARERLNQENEVDPSGASRSSA